MKLACPSPPCRAANDAAAEHCVACGLMLRGYGRLLWYQAQLFNDGLAAARGGELGVARDCFAAVVRWCPLDLEARNAFAMACYALGNHDEARRQWEAVVTRDTSDATAQRGLAAIAREELKILAKPVGKTRRTKR